MSIETNVLFEVSQGLTSIHEIAIKLKLERVQVYAAGRSLAKKNFITIEGKGMASLFSIKVQEPVEEEVPPVVQVVPESIPEVVSEPVVEVKEETITKPLFAISDVFNHHFDIFVESMVKATMDEIELRTRLKMECQVPAMANEYAGVIQESVSKIINDTRQTASETILAQAETMSVPQPPLSPTKTAHRKRLPRVCVTGLKPIEAGRISQEFAETFDLVFWNDRNGDGVEQLRAHAKNCAALFWHVKHGSHSNESIARNGTAEFFRVNGDLSQMRNKMREYYQEKYATKSA